MAKDKRAKIEVKTYATHHVIVTPNPLSKVLRRVSEKDVDDPVARAEQALADLSGEFKNWMLSEADRLSAAYANSPEFWQMIQQRRKEPGIPWGEARKQLDLD